MFPNEKYCRVYKIKCCFKTLKNLEEKIFAKWLFENLMTRTVRNDRSGPSAFTDRN